MLMVMDGYIVWSQYFALIITVAQEGFISEEILYKSCKLHYLIIPWQEYRFGSRSEPVRF